MRVAGIGADPAAQKAQVLQVATHATPTKPAEIRRALAAAYQQMTGEAPAPKLLDVLTAHVEHETAKGTRMMNYNFGGIKGAGPSGLSATYMTREVTSRGDVHIQQPFRAYRSLEEGALDYLAMMRGRYGAALEPASRGDVTGFADELKRMRYYTAAAPEYAAAVGGLVREHAWDAAAEPSGSSPVATAILDRPVRGPEAQGAAGLLSSGDLTRVLDAVAAQSFHVARSSKRDDDDDA